MSLRSRLDVSASLDAFGVGGRLLMALTANGIGDSAERGDKNEACDEKDSFNFHKFALIRVQLSLTHKYGALQRRAGRKTTTKDAPAWGLRD
jgi:hypothetical protein